MTFEEILPELKYGRKIRRQIWDAGEYIVRECNGLLYNGEIPDYDMDISLMGVDILASDWEIIE